MSKPERLLIVSHVTHFAHAGKLYAHAPYAREINLWADLFPQVLIAAPYRTSAPPSDAEAFARPNITVLPQRETGGDTLRAKLVQLALLPLLLWDLSRALTQADAIQVRCPGNLGLLGVGLAPLFSRYRVAKYAGEWQGFPGEAWSCRLQRWLLGSRWWQAPVLTYGEWPRQPAHVVPCFTSVMTEQQMGRARHASARKLEPSLGTEAAAARLNVLYVGRLTRSKNVSVLLAALAPLHAAGLPVHCDIVGAGPEREPLALLAEQLGLGACTTFAGGVDFEQVLAYYENADVLVLASDTEGWGKVLVEAMAFGTVCIGSQRGVIPWMLADGRGIVVAPREVEALTAALRQVATTPDQFLPMRAQAAAWAQRFTLEGLRAKFGEILSQHWGGTFSTEPAPAPQQGHPWAA